MDDTRSVQPPAVPNSGPRTPIIPSSSAHEVRDCLLIKLMFAARRFAVANVLMCRCQERYDPNKPMTVWGLRKPWKTARAAEDLE